MDDRLISLRAIKRNARKHFLQFVPLDGGRQLTRSLAFVQIHQKPASKMLNLNHIIVNVPVLLFVSFHSHRIVMFSLLFFFFDDLLLNAYHHSAMQPDEYSTQENTSSVWNATPNRSVGIALLAVNIVCGLPCGISPFDWVHFQKKVNLAFGTVVGTDKKAQLINVNFREMWQFGKIIIILLLIDWLKIELNWIELNCDMAMNIWVRLVSFTFKLALWNWVIAFRFNIREYIWILRLKFNARSTMERPNDINISNNNLNIRSDTKHLSEKSLLRADTAVRASPLLRQVS